MSKFYCMITGDVNGGSERQFEEDFFQQEDDIGWHSWTGQ